MIRGRRVRASAADGANGPPRLPTATGPTSPGPVPGPPAVPELLMNKTRTFPTTAPFGRSNENRTHRASPVQTYVDPRWPLRCSRVPGSGPPSSSIRIARPSEDPSGPAATTTVTARPLDWSQVKASPSNQGGAHRGRGAELSVRHECRRPAGSWQEGPDVDGDGAEHRLGRRAALCERHEAERRARRHEDDEGTRGPAGVGS